MAVGVQAGSVVGNSSAFHWASTLNSGIVHAVIEVSDSSGNASQIGKTLIVALESVVAGGDVVADVSAIVAHHWNEAIVSLVVAVFDEDTVFVFEYGSGAAYLKREGKAARLLAAPGAVSGKVRPGDVVFLGSGATVLVLPHDKLIALMDHLSAVDIADKLAVYVNGLESNEGCAGIAAEVTEPVAGNPVRVRMPKIGSGSLPPFRMPKISAILPRWRLPPKAVVRRKVLVFLTAPDYLTARISLILTVLFCVSVWVGLQREVFRKQNDASTKSMVEAERMYDEGMALLDLNPITARDRFRQAQTLLTQAETGVNPKSKDGRQIEDLKSRLSENLTRALRITNVDPQVYYDTELIKKDALADYWAVYEDTVVAWDQKGHTLYDIILSPKSGNVGGGGDGMDQCSYVSIHGDNAYVFCPSGIARISLADGKAKKDLIKRTDDWGEIGGMVSYGGNIYLMDTKNGRIWKYVATDTGFTDIREYLNPDTLPDFRTALSFAIDGSVWIGTKDGKILKYTMGREDTFVPKGVDPAFGKQLVVYTDDSLNNLYVLDGDNRRVVVLGKDGMYIAQYVWKGSFQPSSLVVSEKNATILLLAQGKMYAILIK